MGRLPIYPLMDGGGLPGGLRGPAVRGPRTIHRPTLTFLCMLPGDPKVQNLNELKNSQVVHTYLLVV